MSRLNVTEGEWLTTDTASDYVFCVVRRPGMKDVNVESEQDADLMAASKDIYKSLESAMRFIDAHVADPDLTKEMIEAYQALRESNPHQSLAKARGEL